MPQQQLIDHADNDNIDNKCRDEACPGQISFRLWLCAKNRENERDENIGLDREVAEEIDNTAGNRLVLDERLLNVEIELHSQARPRQASDHSRAAALQIERLRRLARRLRFDLHLVFLPYIDSGSPP